MRLPQPTRREHACVLPFAGVVCMPLLLLHHKVDAQVNWQRLTPQQSPSARDFSPMVYDAARGRCVLFGGAGAFLNDTWEFDGMNWLYRQPATTIPSDSQGHGMAYDIHRQRTVKFGGLGSGNGYETYEWDGFDWQLARPPNSPFARIDMAMAYDAARRRVVLFGGYTLTLQVRNDTWEWDGMNWQQRTPALSPAARQGSAMAYDARRQRVVLFSGAPDPVLPLLNDTWEWDGSIWQRMAPPQSPSARYWHAMCYDDQRSRIVLFGGRQPNSILNDVWEWDGQAWTERFPRTTPAIRSRHSMAYDARLGHAVVFGGSDTQQILFDTWTYSPVSPATLDVHGTGCPGSLGRPELVRDPWTLPWLGDSLQLCLRNASPQSTAALFLGVSDAIWGPFVLPLDLTPFQLPGCTLYVSGEALLPMQSGCARVPIPPGTSMIGAVFHSQGILHDPTANPLGLILSNAATARIGSR
jgi:hypothetical protein